METVYAFIDSQNLNLGVRNDVFFKGQKIYSGWDLDFVKFRRYLTDKFRIQTAYLFIGNKPGSEGLYEYLQSAGYVLVLKPTTTYIDVDGTSKVKGNVDTDLVLYAAAKKIEEYDKAVIVSGDGDFLSLCEYLAETGKLGHLIIPNKKRFSQLLTKYSEYFDFVSINKTKLEKTDHKKRRV